MQNKDVQDLEKALQDKLKNGVLTPREQKYKEFRYKKVVPEQLSKVHNNFFFFYVFLTRLNICLIIFSRLEILWRIQTPHQEKAI